MTGIGAPPPPPGNIPPAPPMPVPPVYGGWTPTAGWIRPTTQLATPWRRLGGYLIDALIFAPVWVVVFLAFFLDDLVNDPFWDQIQAGVQPSDAQVREFTLRLQGRLVPYLLLMALLYGVYNVLFTKLKGQTLGKMAVGVKVVSIADGSLPTWGKAVLRWGLPAVVGLIPRVGGLGVLLIYLWMIWDSNKQGLHDKLAKTIVLRIFPGQRL